MRENTCCFTGHRTFSQEEWGEIDRRLDREIDRLIAQGATDFISGAALGFDLTAAAIVVEKRKHHPEIHLQLALPCRDQDKRWSEDQKRSYRAMLKQADSVYYVSDAPYTDGCMRRRNLYMVEHSAYCIYAMNHGRSGTAQTVRMARERGLTLIPVLGRPGA